MNRSLRKPRIIAVAAAAENGVIGKGGTIPWRVKGDFKFWQETSRGKPVIVGRKTFIDMPDSFKKRDKIIVITRDPDYAYPGVYVCHDLEKALGHAHDLCDETGDQEIIIGGGGEIYRQALPHTDEIYLSTIHTVIEGGDAFFPALAEPEWHLTEEPQYFPPEAGDTCGFTLRHYRRAQKA